MKFRAVEENKGWITKGKEYVGSIVYHPDKKTEGSRSVHDIRIVVFDDTGEWRAFHRSTFVPAEA